MKVNTILDIFGALIVLSALALVVRNPTIVSTVGNQFTGALRVAKS
jgi:hypothetical protein